MSWFVVCVKNFQFKCFGGIRIVARIVKVVVVLVVQHREVRTLEFQIEAELIQLSTPAH
jgi:signal transduction protein with GAF and PtsI domain